METRKHRRRFEATCCRFKEGRRYRSNFDKLLAEFCRVHGREPSGVERDRIEASVQARTLRLGILKLAPNEQISGLKPHQRQQYLNAARLEVSYLDALGLGGMKQSPRRKSETAIYSLMAEASD